jgi:glutathione-regulated potassium-efflux system ancillary protein KefF
MRRVMLLIHAHPHPARSIAGRALLAAVRDLPQLTIHSLYDRYPDFDVDPAAEHALFAGIQLVIWQHPLYWYGVPALLKLWFEQVLVRGWAYGDGGVALHGKDCLWVTTTGGLPESYTQNGAHAHAFEAFVPAVRQTARFCGMNWLEPIVVHGGRRIDAAALELHAQQFRERLQQYMERHG